MLFSGFSFSFCFSAFFKSSFRLFKTLWSFFLSSQFRSFFSVAGRHYHALNKCKNACTVQSWMLFSRLRNWSKFKIQKFSLRMENSDTKWYNRRFEISCTFINFSLFFFYTYQCCHRSPKYANKFWNQWEDVKNWTEIAFWVFISSSINFDCGWWEIYIFFKRELHGNLWRVRFARILLQ